MKSKKMILLVIFIFSVSSTIVAEECNFGCHIRKGEYNKITNETRETEFGMYSTSEIEANFEYKQYYAEVYDNDHISYGLSSGVLYQGMIEKINKKIDPEYPIFFNKDNYKKRYDFLIRPILNNKNQLDDIIFAIKTHFGVNGLYKIKNYTLNKEELLNSKMFNYSQNGIHINELTKNDKTKFIINETDSVISYFYFSFKMKSKEQSVITKNDKTNFPFNFNLKYSNSKNYSHSLSNISTNNEFTFPIYEQQTIDKTLNKEYSIKYQLTGIIKPIVYIKNEMKIKCEFNFVYDCYDSNGIAFGPNLKSTYVRELELNKNDVIEVQLPKGLSPKDLGISNDNKSVQHSILLKPSKIKPSNK